MEKCQHLMNLSDQEFQLDKVQTILELAIPSLCHSYLCVRECDMQVELIIVLDRPLVVSKNGTLTLLPKTSEHEPQPTVFEEQLESAVTAEWENPVTPFNGKIEGYEEESKPLQITLDYVAPSFRKCCEAWVAEFQGFGAAFWIWHCEMIVKFRPDGSQDIDHEIKSLVSLGQLPANYLRCLVWFSLGADKSRNVLSLSVGDFLVIRSDKYPTLVGFVQLDWTCLAKLAIGLNIL